MNIYIDESGSFVNTNKENSWNCVVGYMSPEIDTRKLKSILKKLKIDSNFSVSNEIKLNDTTERNYLKFLNRLESLNGALFSVATDASHNSIENIKSHQRNQVSAILKNKPKMIYTGGKQAVQILADQLNKIPPQLYAQLHCQVILIQDILKRGILYFVQRHPRSLGSFKWRIDQKDTSKTIFEDAFEKITPALLQTRSMQKPMLMLKGADYRSFSTFWYSKGEAPTYLQDVYGFDDRDDGTMINLGKITRGNIKFEDSKNNLGVQVADLLASGLRRCLRNEFEHNLVVANILGKLMVAEEHNEPSLSLVGFEETRLVIENLTSIIIHTLTKNSKSMLAAC